jgi:hypothetical protein
MRRGIPQPLTGSKAFEGYHVVNGFLIESYLAPHLAVFKATQANATFPADTMPIQYEVTLAERRYGNYLQAFL